MVAESASNPWFSWYFALVCGLRIMAISPLHCHVSKKSSRPSLPLLPYSPSMPHFAGIWLSRPAFESTLHKGYQ